MKEIAGKKVILTEGEFLRREEANKRYLMKLETPYLLRSYLHEAGRYSGRGPDAEAFGGWEDLEPPAKRTFPGTLVVGSGVALSGNGRCRVKSKNRSHSERTGALPKR